MLANALAQVGLVLVGVALSGTIALVADVLSARPLACSRASQARSPWP
jgi:hypothetical protein